MARSVKPFIDEQASAGHSVLSLGLVRVGVAMKPMFDTVEQARPTRNNICPEHKMQVKHGWMCHHDPKKPHQITDPIKAVNIGSAKAPSFVPTDDTEWKALEEGNDHTIQLSAWVENVDPIFFQKGYYLWPDGLTEATSFNLIQTLLMARGGYLLGTTNTDGTSKVLALHFHPGLGVVIGFMCSHQQYLRVVPAQKIQTAMAALPAPDKKMLDLASQILDALPQSFDLEAIPDVLGKKQWEYVNMKAEGRVKPSAGAASAAVDTPDLMAMLRATQKEVEKRNKPNTKKTTKSTRKRAKA